MSDTEIKTDDTEVYEKLRFGMTAKDIEEYKRKEKEKENPALIH